MQKIGFAAILNNFIGSLLTSRVIHVGYDNLGSFFGKQNGRFPTDPAATTCNEGDLVF
ncbi:hypothetical protein D3C87_1861950 [compost metagenome]